HRERTCMQGRRRRRYDATALPPLPHADPSLPTCNRRRPDNSRPRAHPTLMFKAGLPRRQTGRAFAWCRSDGEGHFASMYIRLTAQGGMRHFRPRACSRDSGACKKSLPARHTRNAIVNAHENVEQINGKRSMTRRWKRRPDGSNWGEFGDDDQLGSLNYIDAAAVLRAAREIREGRPFCLSLPLDYPGGRSLAPIRFPPTLKPTERDGTPVFNQQARFRTHMFCDVVCDDQVLMCTQYSTQWDSFAHVGSM